MNTSYLLTTTLILTIVQTHLCTRADAAREHFVQALSQSARTITNSVVSGVSEEFQAAELPLPQDFNQEAFTEQFLGAEVSPKLHSIFSEPSEAQIPHLWDLCNEGYEPVPEDHSIEVREAPRDLNRRLLQRLSARRRMWLKYRRTLIIKKPTSRLAQDFGNDVASQATSAVFDRFKTQADFDEDQQQKFYRIHETFNSEEEQRKIAEIGFQKFDELLEDVDALGLSTASCLALEVEIVPREGVEGN